MALKRIRLAKYFLAKFKNGKKRIPSRNPDGAKAKIVVAYPVVHRNVYNKFSKFPCRQAKKQRRKTMHLLMLPKKPIILLRSQPRFPKIKSKLSGSVLSSNEEIIRAIKVEIQNLQNSAFRRCFEHSGSRNALKLMKIKLEKHKLISINKHWIKSPFVLF